VNKIKIFGIIISAGLSGRMNRFKPLANYKGKSFLYNIISKLNSVCDKVIVVIGHESDRLQLEIRNELKGKNRKIIFVHNKFYLKGMFTSLQTGLIAARESDWILYHFVDQPGVPLEFYSDFVNQVDRKHNWIQPMNNAKKGHPILFGKDLFNLIISEPDSSNLRELSHSDAFKKKFWECGYSEILQDIDTDSDYLKLK
jgi:CTP:molybdopterin cytidylyltransferase MocA